MSKRTLYILAAVFLFLLFTLANLPLSTVLKWSGAEERGLRWRDVAGTVWYGALTEATYKNYPVGTVRVKTFFLPLLIGRASAIISVTGPALAAKGQVSASFREQFSIKKTALVLDLGQYNIRDAFDAPMSGVLRLDINRLDLVGRACRHGDFELWTDSLVMTARQYGGVGFPLQGQGHCDDGDIVLPVNGTGASEQVDLQVILSGNLDYRAEARVRSNTPSLIAALRLNGFDSKGDQLVMIQRGNLLTTP